MACNVSEAALGVNLTSDFLLAQSCPERSGEAKTHVQNQLCDFGSLNKLISYALSIDNQVWRPLTTFNNLRNSLGGNCLIISNDL